MYELIMQLNNNWMANTRSGLTHSAGKKTGEVI